MTSLIAAGLVLSVGLHTQASQDPTPTVDRLTLSQPASVLVIDTGKIKGEPRKLAWSPHATELYLLAYKDEGKGLFKLLHYVISLEKRTIQSVAGEPVWAGAYWARKSAKEAPSDRSVSIQVDTRKEHVQGGPAIVGGAMSGSALTGQSSMSSPEPNLQEMNDRNFHGNDIVTYTLTLEDEVVGQWEQGKMIPGQTFSWSPADLGAIAFTDKDGGVVVMDLAKDKQAVAGSKAATLPAWSDDGALIAYLQKSGKKQYSLQIVEVGRR